MLHQKVIKNMLENGIKKDHTSKDQEITRIKSQHNTKDDAKRQLLHVKGNLYGGDQYVTHEINKKRTPQGKKYELIVYIR